MINQIERAVLEAEVDLESLRGLDKFDPIRISDIASIRYFVGTYAHWLTGKVLDFGAGVEGSCREPQPFRALLPAGLYVPADIEEIPAGDPAVRETLLHERLMELAPFDAILCTQVLHYLEDGGALQIRRFRALSRPGTALVMTYATNWDEVERVDSLRCTKAHMERMLRAAGFEIVDHRRRNAVIIGNFRFPIGYGVFARAT